MAFVIDHVLEIDAAPDVVWRVLTDFERYGEWNPMAVRCATSLVPGDPIDMSVRLGLVRIKRQREWVRTHTPGQEFSYAMKPVPFGALRSRRRQSVTPLDGGRTRYESRFELHGWLQPLVRLLLGRALKRGFAGATAGVRAQAETA
jgi:hypothetical protein